MVDLEKIIAHWRKHLLDNSAISREALDELESHLRDDIDRRVQAGASLPDAFHSAAREIGSAEQLKTEFANSQPARMERGKLAKIVIAGHFLITLFLLLAKTHSALPIWAFLGVAAGLTLFLAILLKWILDCDRVGLEPNLAGFSPEARQSLDFAREEAPRLHHDFIGTEHLLLGIARIETGSTPALIKSLGLSPEALRREIEKLAGAGSKRSIAMPIPLTPRARRALRIAVSESKSLNHGAIRPAHILLGLLLEPDGVATRVLKNHGLKIETARAEVAKALGGS